MTREAKPIELRDLHELLAWNRLIEEVRTTREARTIRVDGEDVAILSPAQPVRQRTRSKPITEQDPLWRLVGSATDAPPTDSSRKHEYLAEAYSPKQP